MDTLTGLRPADLQAAVVAFRDALRSHRERLNRLNVYPVPDGDTGTNMTLTVESVVEELERGAGGEAMAMADVCRALSHGSLMGARGNSGIILSQLLRALAGHCAGREVVDGPVLAAALGEASAAAYTAVARPVEGTILTVARAAAEGAAGAAAGASAAVGVGGRGGAGGAGGGGAGGGDAIGLVGVLEAARAAAEDAVARTPELLPVLAQAGVVDAGGAGFVLLLDALLHVAAGRPLPEPPSVPSPASAPPSPSRSGTGVAAGGAAAGVTAAGGGHEPGGNGDLRYEVTFLLEAPDEDVPRFREAWTAVGDSIVVVGGDGTWSCHIHTDDIGAAIEAGIDAGRPRRIHVTDLAEQVEEERWVREALAAPAGPAPAGPAPAAPAGPAGPAGPHHAGVNGSDATRPPASPHLTAPPADAPRCAVVAVAAGEGVARLFESLGATVVAGGQSANPSTAEVLAAVEQTGAGEVVVLPNNRNVVPVAEQVGGLTTRTVRVVPTTTVPEGLAALVAYDPDSDAEANAEAIAGAAEGVASGEVTRAVRASATAAGPVAEGDWLGLTPDGVAVVAGTLEDAVTALLDRIVGDDHEIVTLVEGEGATAELTSRLTTWLAEHRPGVEVEVHPGGQPLYPYLIGAE